MKHTVNQTVTRAASLHKSKLCYKRKNNVAWLRKKLC